MMPDFLGGVILMLADALPSFVQSLNPAQSTLGSTLVALIPVVLLLVLLPVLRMSAWQAVIIGAVVTIILAITVWSAPAGGTFGAWGVGAGTGIWSIDWITFWGVIIYNTLVTPSEWRRSRTTRPCRSARWALRSSRWRP
jgi:L-lactate permease